MYLKKAKKLTLIFLTGVPRGGVLGLKSPHNEIDLMKNYSKNQGKIEFHNAKFQKFTQILIS